MSWESYQSPEASDNEDFSAQLELNSKVLLDSFKSKEQYFDKPSSNITITLPSRHESPTKKYQDSVKSKIIELEEEQSNLYSKLNLQEQDSNFKNSFVETSDRNNLGCHLLKTKFEVYEQTPIVCNKLQKHNSDRQQSVIKQYNQLLNKFKVHQRFIVELLFSFKLVDRLEIDLDLMLTVAEEKYYKIKEQANRKQEEQKRKRDEQLKRVEVQKIQRQKDKAEKERIEAEQMQKMMKKKFKQQKQKENSYTNEQTKSRIKSYKQSPTKLFKPYNKSIQFTNKSKLPLNIHQTNKKANLQNQIPHSQSFFLPSNPKRSPTKPRTSFAFQRKGSYITNSPKKSRMTGDQKIKQQLQLMSAGRTLKKRCPLTGTLEQVDVYCSPDYTRLIIRFPNYDTLTEEVKSMKQICNGRLLGKYERQTECCNYFEDGFSFSIVFPNREFELRAESSQQRMQFIEALYGLRNFSRTI